MNSGETKKFKGAKKLGERIKGNLSKRWKGVKNIFGNEAAKDAKDALEELRKEAKDEYSKLSVTKLEATTEQVRAVWTKLQAALVAINNMCDDDDVTDDENGKGRAYAKAVLGGKFQKDDESITNFDYKEIKDFNKFEDHVLKLQQIANKTSRTSAIPSVIQDAAKETSRFYAYAYAYACSSPISEKFDEIKNKLQNEKTLWNRIKKFIFKGEGEFLGQLDVDSNKVAREIYKQAKTAKIRGLLHTKKYMQYFTNSIKDLFGMYTEEKVINELSYEDTEEIFSGNKNSKGVSSEVDDNIEEKVEETKGTIINKISESKNKKDDK